MNQEYIDGNIAGGADTSYRLCEKDEFCHDPDRDCPLTFIECCWGCRIADQCKSVCENVAVKK